MASWEELLEAVDIFTGAADLKHPMMTSIAPPIRVTTPTCWRAKERRAIRAGTMRRNPGPRGWGNPYQQGTMTLLSPAEAVFRDRAGHQVRFRLRSSAKTFKHVCA